MTTELAYSAGLPAHSADAKTISTPYPACFGCSTALHSRETWGESCVVRRVNRQSLCALPMVDCSCIITAPNRVTVRIGSVTDDLRRSLMLRVCIIIVSPCIKHSSCIVRFSDRGCNWLNFDTHSLLSRVLPATCIADALPLQESHALHGQP
jgi:hypothetical protein